MFRKQKDYPLTKMEKRILEEWETAWKGAQGEDDDENTQTDANKMLYDLVRENYKIFARKALGTGTIILHRRIGCSMASGSRCSWKAFCCCC